MTVLLGVLLFALLFGAIFMSVEYPEIYPAAYKRVTGGYTGKNTYGYSHHEVAGLSEQSLRVLKYHHTLPNDHRLDADLVNVLRSYDLKNGGTAKVDDHFSKYGGGCYCAEYWNGTDYNRKCPMPDYRSLYDSIQSIKAALVEQQEALAAAAVAGVTNNMPLLIEHAREEAAIIKSTTKELL